MHETINRPILTVYRREGCHLCDDARAMLQAALEERVIRGEPIPIVRELDIDADPELQARYFELIPVFALGGVEMNLVTSSRQVQALLDRQMPRIA